MMLREIVELYLRPSEAVLVYQRMKFRFANHESPYPCS